MDEETKEEKAKHPKPTTKLLWLLVKKIAAAGLVLMVAALELAREDEKLTKMQALAGRGP